MIVDSKILFIVSLFDFIRVNSSPRVEYDDGTA